MSRFQAFHLSFFGGKNEDENPDALGDTELVDAFNVWRRGRTTGTRPGTQLDPDVYSSAISGNPSIVGIADYRYDRGTSRDLVVMVPGAIHDGPSSTLTLGAGVVVTNAAGKPWTFAQHDNKLYAAGGDVEAATKDTPWFWDGSGNPTLIQIQNLSAQDMSPRFFFEWNNRIYAGGFPATNADNSAGPGVVRFSSLNEGDVWPEENTIGGFSAVGGLSSSGSEYVTGANSYRDNNGDFLLIFTNRFIYSYRLTGNVYQPLQQTDVIPFGCVAHNAYVSLGLDSGDGIYLSEHGIHSLRQSQRFGEKEDSILSFKIRETFETINRSRLDQVQGAYWRERGVVIFAVPTGSSTVNDTILALNVRDVSSGSAIDPQQDLTRENAVWHVWKLAGTDHYGNFLLSGQDANEAWQIFGGNGNGEVFRFTDAVYSDLGNGYTSRMQTKYMHFGTPFYRKIVGDSLIDIQPGGDYKPTCQLVFDYGRRSGKALQLDMPSIGSRFGPTGGARFGPTGTARFGSANTQQQTRLYTQGSGDTVSWKFQHSGTNEPFFIARLSAEVATMGEAANG